MLEEALPEIRCRIAVIESDDVLEGVITRISSWEKMKRVVARALAWRNPIKWIISQENLRRAESLLLCQAQKRCPPEAPIGLKPAKDAYEVIRLQVRLGYMEGSPKVSLPAALAGESLLALRILEELHLKEFHAGARHVVHLAHVELGIFVIGGKGLAKKVIRDCPVCRAQHQRLMVQPMAPLPEDRLSSDGPAFDQVCLDFFETKGARKKPPEGIKILIIVCQATRAAHLERVKDLSASAFTNAWTRFVCKRGVWPRLARSDKAPTFRRGAAFLNSWAAKWHEAMTSYGIGGDKRPVVAWADAVPRAPHRLGTVEAIIKGVKRALIAGLRAMTSRDPDAWDTLLAKVNFMINSRPLDPGYWTDLTQAPITANDILHPYLRTRMVPECPADSVGAVQQAVHDFWVEWRNQVPPELLPATKWNTGEKNWQEGDLVLIKRLQRGGIQIPKGQWPKGVISTLHPSRDGVVRKVSLRLASGKTTQAATPYLILLMRETGKENGN